MTIKIIDEKNGINDECHCIVIGAGLDLEDLGFDDFLIENQLAATASQGVSQDTSGSGSRGVSEKTSQGQSQVASQEVVSQETSQKTSQDTSQDQSKGVSGDTSIEASRASQTASQEGSQGTSQDNSGEASQGGSQDASAGGSQENSQLNSQDNSGGASGDASQGASHEGSGEQSQLNSQLNSQQNSQDASRASGSASREASNASALASQLNSQLNSQSASRANACVDLWTDSFGYTEDPISNGGIWDHYSFTGTDQWAADGTKAAIGSGAHRDLCVADKYLCSENHYVELSGIVHDDYYRQLWIILRNANASASESSQTRYRMVIYRGNSTPAITMQRVEAGVVNQIGTADSLVDTTWETIRGSVGNAPLDGSLICSVDGVIRSSKTDTNITTGRYAGFGGGSPDANGTPISIDAIEIGTSD